MLDWMAKYVGGPSTVVFIGVFITVCGTLISAGGALWAFRQRARADTDLAASVIGGDSFCYMSLALGGNASFPPLCNIVHQGKYPLYDVTVRFSDLDEWERLGDKKTFESLSQVDTILKLGNIAPSQSVLIGRWPLKNETDHYRYNVFFSARNGFFTQNLRLHRVKGRWLVATRMRRGITTNTEIIYEKVDPDFPREANGQIVWD